MDARYAEAIDDIVSGLRMHDMWGRLGWAEVKRRYRRTMISPFWSSLSRAKKIVATVRAYSEFEPVELSWTEFVERWVPGLSRDGIQVGINWSGPRAAGYDVDPEQVVRNVAALRSKT